MCEAAHQVSSIRMRCGSAGALSSNLNVTLTHQRLVLSGQGIDATLQLAVSLPPLALPSLKLLSQKLDLLSEILRTYKKRRKKKNTTVQHRHQDTHLFKCLIKCLKVKMISGHDSGLTFPEQPITDHCLSCHLLDAPTQTVLNIIPPQGQNILHSDWSDVKQITG